MKLVVIGGVAAGMSAASKAKRIIKDLDVKVFERSHYVSYGACGLPYFVQGVVPKAEDLVARTPEQFRKQGVEPFLRHEVVEIDHENRFVWVEDLENHKRFKAPYDRLVIATGASAVRPPLPGVDLPGVHVVKLVEDGIAIRKSLKQGAKRAVIVGGGYIGLEMSEALRARGLDVTVVELMDRLVPRMDPMLSGEAMETLQRHGVKVMTGTRVQGIEGDDRVRRVVTDAGNIDCDIVIMAIGVRPNTKLAQSIGAKVGPTGAIEVDDAMQTSVQDVYAAGDNTQSINLLTGRPVYLPLGDIANKHGRTAGVALTGRPAAFKGVVATAMAKVFDRALATTGLTEAEAQAAGFDVGTVSIKSANQAHYIPGKAPFKVKLCWNRADGRLLGAQIAGTGNDALRIDAIAALLHMKGTIQDLRGLDLAYAPPFSPVWDPILVAANVAK